MVDGFQYTMIMFIDYLARIFTIDPSNVGKTTHRYLQSLFRHWTPCRRQLVVKGSHLCDLSKENWYPGSLSLLLNSSKTQTRTCSSSFQICKCGLQRSFCRRNRTNFTIVQCMINSDNSLFLAVVRVHAFYILDRVKCN